MKKREIILVTAMMYVLCSGCSKTQQNNTAVTTTASYDEIMKTENDETKSRMGTGSLLEICVL